MGINHTRLGYNPMLAVIMLNEKTQEPKRNDSLIVTKKDIPAVTTVSSNNLATVTPKLTCQKTIPHDAMEKQRITEKLKEEERKAERKGEQEKRLSKYRQRCDCIMIMPPEAGEYKSALPKMGRVLKALCGFIDHFYSLETNPIVYKVTDHTDKDQRMFSFQSKQPPLMPITHYMRRMFIYTEMSFISFFTTICLLMRFHKRIGPDKFPHNILTFHRLFLSSASLSIKMCDDYHETADMIYRTAGLQTVHELLILETEFIHLLNCELLLTSSVSAQALTCFINAIPILDTHNVFKEPKGTEDEPDFWPAELHNSVLMQLRSFL
jgi:hypothetical protein